MSRILTALVAVPLLLALIFLAPPWAFSLFVGITAIIGFWEFSQIAAAMGMPAIPAAGYPATLVFTLLFTPPVAAFGKSPVAAPLAVVASVILLSAIVSILSSKPPAPKRIAGVCFTVFGSLYVGLLAFVAGLRTLGGDSEGRWWVAFLLLVVMMSDTGAFYAGKNLGKHKLAPKLSPKKTVEGLVGGLAAGAAAAYCFALVLPTGRSEVVLAGVGLCLSLSGVAGDLFESSLKRAADVKDASALIPGHGGLLDRLDSILFAAPVLWLYLQL